MNTYAKERTAADHRRYEDAWRAYITARASELDTRAKHNAAMAAADAAWQEFAAIRLAIDGR